MNLKTKINKHYNILNDSDLYIWDYIQNNIEECKKITIEELAKKCNVSRTTITRFTKKIGLEGYFELKYLLKNEIAINESSIGNFIDIDGLFNNHLNMIKDLLKKDYSYFCEMLYGCDKVYVVSTGNVQQSVARELKRQFLKIGIIMTHISGQSEIIRFENCVKSNDMIIMISLTGENEYLLDLAKTAAIRNAKTVSITKLSNNSLSNLVNEPIYLVFGDTPGSYVTGYVSATMYFSMTEILYATFFNYLEKKKIDENNL